MRVVLLAAIAVAFITSAKTVSAGPEAVFLADLPGRDVYEAACRRCHGADGGGEHAPTLIPFGWSYSQARDIVRRGSCGMPAFPESELSEEAIKQIVDYLKAVTEHVNQEERRSHGSTQRLQTGRGRVRWSAPALGSGH
jgi:mono/diheme cytochrome c family protein